MLCFGAFGDVPYEDVAIVTRRQHYPAVKGMGLQDKHLVCMALPLKIAHHRETRKIHISRICTTQPKAPAVPSVKLNPRQPQRFEHSKGKNFLDSSKSCRNMKLLSKDPWAIYCTKILFIPHLFFLLFTEKVQSRRKQQILITRIPRNTTLAVPSTQSFQDQSALIINSACTCHCNSRKIFQKQGNFHTTKSWSNCPVLEFQTLSR